MSASAQACGAAPRCALITGGSQGIGRAVALRLGQMGWHVVTLDREPPALLLPDERFHRIDLADRQGLDALLRDLAGRHTITGLVNNAGLGEVVPLEHVGVESFEQMGQINLWCPIQCLQAVLPSMRREGWGRVVNISSRAALGKPGRSLYSATKAGLHGLTRTWALELADSGITVNTVSPGPIGTEMFHRLNPPGAAQTAAIVDAVPLRRIGDADEVAHAVAYFMDEGAGFTTGQLLHVCGGLTVGGAGM